MPDTGAPWNLTYPDDTGSVDTWLHWQQLAEDTAAALDDLEALGAPREATRSTVLTAPSSPVNNSVVVVGNTALRIPVLSGITYVYDLEGCFVSNATADIRIAVAPPGGSNTLRGTILGRDAGGTLTYGEQAGGEIVFGANAGSSTPFRISGGCIPGADGYLTPSFAQSVATGVDTYLDEGVKFTVREIWIP